SLHSSLPSCFVVFFSFFFNAPPPPHIYTLSLHDALPISFPPASKSATSPSLISRESVRWPSIVPQFGRPRPVELNLAVVERFERLAVGIAHHQTRDCYRLASQRFSTLLEAVESAPRRPAQPYLQKSGISFGK